MKQICDSDIPLSIVASLLNIAMMLIRTGKLRVSKEYRDAWVSHGKNDHYLTMAEIRDIAQKKLPGVK